TPGDRLYMRTNAMAYGFGYFDGWTPFMDTHQMLSRGWIAGDLVHGLVSGYGAYDSLLTYWLALDAPVNSPGLTNLNITVSFLPTNALSSWPMAARTPGGAAQVNSNGTIYMLVSGPGSTAWTKTNYISGP